MKKIGIGIVGLGNIGSRLYKEIISKKKDIGLKTSTNITIAAISARNINKKRKYKINKKIFYKNPLDIFKKEKIDILFELIGSADGISKKVVQVALNKKIHVITANKASIDNRSYNIASIYFFHL